MDFPRKCNTSVYAIDGFSTIYYCRYILASSQLDPSNAAAYIWHAQCLLRDHGFHVAPDLAKRSLWLFAGPNATPDGATGEVTSLRGVKDIINKQRQTFDCAEFGKFQAASIDDSAVRATKISTPSTASNAAKSPENDASETPRTLYRYFILAILSSLSYTLARSYDMIPLTVRFLFSKSLFDAHHEHNPSTTLDIKLMRIDAQLCSQGVLLISCAKSLSGDCTPLARDKASHSESLGSPFTRVSGNGETWKKASQLWLRSKGVQLQNPSAADTWIVLPGTAAASVAPKRASIQHGQQTFYEWPAALCLAEYEPSNKEGAQTHSSFAEVPEPGVSLDPAPPKSDFSFSFDFAQRWFLGAGERQKAIQALRVAERVEQESTHDQVHLAPHNASLPSSPVYARAGDLAGLNAIYPTPPDGFISQAPHNITIVATDHPTDARTDGFQGIAEANQGRDVDDQIHFSVVAESIPQDSEVPNELFDDMEEDNFGGAGVTDADFSFFDEPGGDELSVAVEEDKSGAMETDVADGTRIKEEEPEAIPNPARQDDHTAEQHKPDVSDDHVDKENTTAEELREIHVQDEDGIQLENQEEKGTASSLTDPHLTPSLVRQRLFDDDKGLSPSVPEGHTDRASTFQPIPFGHRVATFEEKYGRHGRFGFRFKERQGDLAGGNNSKPSQLSNLQTVRLPDRRLYVHGKPVPATSAMPSGGPQDSTDEGYSSDTESEEDSDDEDSSANSQQQTEAASNEGQNRDKKRKRGNSDTDSPSISTPIVQVHSSSQMASRPTTTQEACELLLYMDECYWEAVSIPGHRQKLRNSQVMSSSERKVHSLALNHKDAINIAQVLADECIYDALDTYSGAEGASDREQEDNAMDGTVEGEAFRSALKRLFPACFDCDLSTFSSFQDVAAESSSSKPAQRPGLPRRLTETPISSTGRLFRLSPPFIRLQRAETALEVLPTATHFWDSLNLGPISGPKDVSAFCIYPSGIRNPQELFNFFDCLGNVYESRRLGTHMMRHGDQDANMHLIAYDFEGISPVSEQVRRIQSVCTGFGRALSTRREFSSHIVIYLVDAFESWAPHVGLSQAAWTLNQAYHQSSPSSRIAYRKPELIVKVLPVDVIPRENAVLDPELGQMTRLAHEIYDRLLQAQGDGHKSGLSIQYPPAIQLAPAMPRSIQFKVTADPPPDLLDENSYLHLGYCKSPSAQWITAAWTDNTGISQATASYSLHGREFQDIAREMWEATLSVLRKKRVSWGVLIVKEGLLTAQEKELWKKLWTTPTQPNLTTMLLSTDTSPNISLSYDKLPNLPPSEPQQKSHPYTGSSATNIATPISTPTPGPDNASAAPSPSTPADGQSEFNTDGYLVDETDETWGVILGTRMHTSHTLGEYNPSLVSGLLVKRGDGTRRQLPCIAVHINAGHSSSGAASSFNSALLASSPGTAMRGYEMLLREILSMYRGLAALANVRYMDDGLGGILPWHLVAARRGANGLDRYLPV
ncbi:MAG: mediator of RNA polymerase II transcription subunit 13 [Bogoriella megaspora]|nr:MAG: mediator of RNA polymerase II transcription subunit 13 [Bogoriella megaspora]